jgi:hypothetical protein
VKPDVLPVTPKAPAKKKAPVSQPAIETSPVLAPEAEEKLKQKVAKAKATLPKPELEGINVAKSTSDVIMVAKPKLTAEENKLIEEIDEVEIKKPEPKLMPASVVDRVNQKPGGGKKVFAILIILLVLSGAGYAFYNWKSADSKDAGDNNATLPVANADPSPWDAGTSTSTEPAATSTTPVTLTPTPPAATTTPASDKKLKITSTPTGYLNFRQGPGLNYAIITKVYPGEVYTYTTKQGDWYRILHTDGRPGWVNSQYITVQ